MAVILPLIVFVPLCLFMLYAAAVGFSADRDARVVACVYVAAVAALCLIEAVA